MEADKEYAARKVAELDEWARGAVFGAVFATLFWAGLAWAVMEPLK